MFSAAFPVAGAEKGTAAIVLHYKTIPSHRRNSLLSGFTRFQACLVQSVRHRAAVTATELGLASITLDIEQQISEKWY